MSRARRQSLRAALDGRPLAELVPAEAIADGRVFVDGVRATAAGSVPRAGALIDVYAAREPDEPVRIIAREARWIAAYKPAAIATEPDRQGAKRSLLHEVARLLELEPGALHAVSRLDVGVSGVVLIAQKPLPKTPIQSSRVYVGIAERAPEPACGVWTSDVDGRRAESRYQVVEETASGAALLRLEPETGRTHQLRIHAARAGAALFGDRAHGGRPRLTLDDGSVVEVRGIALHASALEVGDFRAIAPVAERLVELWKKLGGDPAAFHRC